MCLKGEQIPLCDTELAVENASQTKIKTQHQGCHGPDAQKMASPYLSIHMITVPKTEISPNLRLLLQI